MRLDIRPDHGKMLDKLWQVCGLIEHSKSAYQRCASTLHPERVITPVDRRGTQFREKEL
jgi:hypothetical protein